MLRRLNKTEDDHVRNEDHDTIAQTVSNYNVHGSTLHEQFNVARNGVDLGDLHDKWENEKEMIKDWDDMETAFNGRMSPFAKELVYRSYLKGATVKDLSLKFGILAQRVKAIIY